MAQNIAESCFPQTSFQTTKLAQEPVHVVAKAKKAYHRHAVLQTVDRKRKAIDPGGVSASKHVALSKVWNTPFDP